MGWDVPSAPSAPITTKSLPEVAEGYERLEVKFTVAAQAKAPPAEWGQGFAANIAVLLSLDASDVHHVETRARGRFVIFDVPESYGNAKHTPSEELARLMQEPPCSAGANKAAGRRGRVSISCTSENATSPSLVNDGDLRQHSPFVWQACLEDNAAWWAVELQDAVTDPIVRVLFGQCCAERNRNELTLLIGTEDSIESAVPCSHLAQLNDSSAVVTVCRGTGTWLFVSAQSSDDVPAPGLALAEVEICDAGDTHPLYSSQFSRGLDISAGIVRIEEARRTRQIAPQLLPVGMGKDANWRTAVARADWSTTQWRSLTLAFLLLFGLAAVVRCKSSNEVSRPAGKARHARLRNEEDTGVDGEPPGSGSENGDAEVGDAGSGSETEDDDILGQRVLITFETRDGTAVQSSLSIANVASMEQLFAKVSRAGTAAGFHTMDHMSLQYVDHLTQRIEQAWHDPILNEGSDIDVVKKSTQLRVLLLGDVCPEQATRNDAVTSAAIAGPLGSSGSPNTSLAPEPIYLGEDTDIEVAVSRI